MTYLEFQVWSEVKLTYETKWNIFIIEDAVLLFLMFDSFVNEDCNYEYTLLFVMTRRLLCRSWNHMGPWCTETSCRCCHMQSILQTHKLLQSRTGMQLMKLHGHIQCIKENVRSRSCKSRTKVQPLKCAYISLVRRKIGKKPYLQESLYNQEMQCIKSSKLRPIYTLN